MQIANIFTFLHITIFIFCVIALLSLIRQEKDNFFVAKKISTLIIIKKIKRGKNIDEH